MLTSFFKDLSHYLNWGFLAAGLLLGAGLVILVQIVARFIAHHWKAILITCAVICTIALVIMAL